MRHSFTGAPAIFQVLFAFCNTSTPADREQNWAAILAWNDEGAVHPQRRVEFNGARGCRLW
jgi:hypothetical protein